MEECNLHRGIANGCVKAGLNTEVVVIPRNTGRPDSYYNTILIQKFKEFKPDLFLSVKGGCILPATIREISKTVKTINWQIDDPYEFKSGESRRLAQPYNFVFTTDKDTFPLYRKPGGVLPFAFDTQCHKNLNLSKDTNASFVGSNFPGRMNFLKNVLRIKCFGAKHSRFEKGRISHSEMVQVINRSRININFSDQPDGKLGLKNRIFEVLGCGGFLLTQNSYDLKDYITPGVHCVTFETVFELKEKINYYIRNEEEREKIAQQGYLFAKENCKYSDRIKKILEVVK